MDDKPVGGVWGWIFGILLGLILPAVGCFFVALLWFKKPGDLFNARAGFFGCLLCAGALAGLGLRGWRRWTFARGVTVGAGVWLAALPFLAGSCLQ